MNPSDVHKTSEELGKSPLHNSPPKIEGEYLGIAHEIESVNKTHHGEKDKKGSSNTSLKNKPSDERSKGTEPLGSTNVLGNINHLHASIDGAITHHVLDGEGLPGGHDTPAMCHNMNTDIHSSFENAGTFPNLFHNDHTHATDEHNNPGRPVLDCH